MNVRLILVILIAVLHFAYGCYMISKDNFRGDIAIYALYAGLVMIPTTGLIGVIEEKSWLTYIFGGMCLLVCLLCSRVVGVALSALAIYIISPKQLTFQFMSGASCIVCYLLLILLGRPLSRGFHHG